MLHIQLRGLKRAALLAAYANEAQFETSRGGLPLPTLLLLDLRARRREATGASVSIVKWDEHGARSLRVSRERSRHGGDSAARWVITLPAIRLRQIRGARACLGTSPRSRGGRSTAGGPAVRAHCSAWDVGRSGRAR